MALPQRKFHELVLQTLFAKEIGGVDSTPHMALLMEECAVSKKNALEVVKEVERIWEQRPLLDERIAQVSTSYRLERIQVTERAILRWGFYSLLFNPQLSLPVVIAEAIRLTKKFSTKEAATFVHALLDTFAHHHV